ncbi:MAG: long-chain fatty acid--CoA ligase [Gemmatimonadota bacterium]
MATTLEHAANSTPVPESTLTGLFFEATDRFGGREIFQRFESADRVVGIGYDDVVDVVRKVSGGLRARGLERGEKAAILSENRPEWAFVDYGCLCAGVVAVPVYPTLLPGQVQYILEDSGARMVFASTPELVEKARQAVEGCEHDIEIVAFDETVGPAATGWTDFLADGAVVAEETGLEAWRSEALSAEPHDVATVLYTSGTTGTPKGVMLTHNNVASNVRAAVMILDIGETDNTVSFLPLSHILQRMIDYLFFWVGCRVGYARSMETLIDDIGTLAPTVVVSVPRIYEKIYNGVMGAEGFKKRIVEWAAGVADRAADLRLAGQEPAGVLALQYRLADKLVFSKVKNRVGGRLRFFVSGGGPLAPALNRFFYSIGMTILEGYGLTETSPVTNVNTDVDFRIGSVGKPIPGTEIRIAGDGEILVRGPQVMKGYFNLPDATAAAIDGDGWFATGDIGEIDAEGFLSITDRKKDILVTAGGKNVAPQPIENHLKTHAYVEQAVVVGDRRRYCTLLVVPDFGALGAWASSQGIEGGPEQLAQHPKVVAHVEAELLGMLGSFASYERPKKVALLAEEFSVENGMLTPTLKIKRNVVQVKLDDVIDGLSAGEAADATAY